MRETGGAGTHSFFLMAYEFDEPLAALMSSSATASTTRAGSQLVPLERATRRRRRRGRRTALGDALDVAERRLADTDGDERDGLVDAAERRDVDGLAADGALRADAGRVLAGASVDDGVDEDLDRVLVREEVDDLERVGDDADGLRAGKRRRRVRGVSDWAKQGLRAPEANGPSASCRCCGRSS